MVDFYEKTYNTIFVEKNMVYIFGHDFFSRIVVIFEFIEDDSQKFRGWFA